MTGSCESEKTNIKPFPWRRAILPLGYLAPPLSLLSEGGLTHCTICRQNEEMNRLHSAFVLHLLPGRILRAWRIAVCPGSAAD